MKKILCVILCLCMVFAITACTGEKEEVDLYQGKKIQGMSVDGYTSTIKSLVKSIYAPQSEEEFRSMMPHLNKYVNSTVYTKFTSVAPDFENETFESTIDWRYSVFADGKYQPDGNDRLYFEFDVVRNYKHYPIRLEFIVGGNELIVDYSVY